MTVDDDGVKKGGSALMWILAVAATLGTVLTIALVLTNLVPRSGPPLGETVGGVNVEAMRHACKLARGELGVLCGKTGLVDKTLRAGRCPAARAMARQVLSSGENLGPLASDMRGYVQARLVETCGE
ncbi:MAG: hypothetical protein ACI9MC_000592 [Kiritimatiellia bacterium]